VQGVTYPALSRLEEDEALFSNGYRRILMLTSFALFPVMLGLVAIAPEMFAILLGDKWMPTVPYFEILALAGVAYPLSVVAYNILKVRSDGRVILRLEILKRVIMTLILAYTIPRSVEAVAWGMTAMAFIDLAINLVASMRFVEVSVVSLLHSFMPQLLLAGVMFLALHLLNPSFDHLSLGVRLLVDVAVGGVIYIGGAALLRLRAFYECVSILKGFGKR
jgi:O-antigen/teichoic acid export membrane protein